MIAVDKMGTAYNVINYKHSWLKRHKDLNVLTHKWFQTSMRTQKEIFWSPVNIDIHGKNKYNASEWLMVSEFLQNITLTVFKVRNFEVGGELSL